MFVRTRDHSRGLAVGRECWKPVLRPLSGSSWNPASHLKGVVPLCRSSSRYSCSFLSPQQLGRAALSPLVSSRWYTCGDRCRLPQGQPSSWAGFLFLEHWKGIVDVSGGVQSSSPKCLQGSGGCSCDTSASGSSKRKCTGSIIDSA